MQTLENFSHFNTSGNELFKNDIKLMSSNQSKNYNMIDQSSWAIAELIGGQISIDLANSITAKNSRKGSKNSCLQVKCFFCF